MTPLLQVFKAFIQSLGDMGDIIDMAVKASEGKATYSVGELVNRATTGAITNLTAAASKDLYFAGADVSLNNIEPLTASTGLFKIDITRNGTTIDSWSVSLGGGETGSASHIFEIGIGSKVDATQKIEMNLAVVGASCTVYGTIYGWQEDDGVSPQI